MAWSEYGAELRQDTGYAFRILRRSPGFTAAALLTLALGIGANSAIFSVVQGVLLESLPYRNADHLYRLRMLRPDGTTSLTFSAPDFMSIRQDTRVFAHVEAYTTEVSTLVGASEPVEIRVAAISEGLFGLLGLPVAVGRGFLSEENRPGLHNVAVLDHGFWQREFGSNPDVLGRTLTIGGDNYQIVGVLARGARLPANAPVDRLRSEADVYLPLRFDETFSATTATRRRANYLGVFALARPGITAGQVDDDLRRVGAALQTAFPETNATLTFNAISPKDLMLGDVRRPLLLLLGAVGFLLLVACANVANLLLARGSARQTEFAVRAALGARGARLMRQLLTEALVLAVIGAAAGLAIASWSTSALVAARPVDIPRLQEIGIDGTVILFTVSLALLTTLVFGLLPARQTATPSQLSHGLREGGRGGGGSAGGRLRDTLMVVEIALSVVLLTGAGLLVRSFIELTRVDPGFETEQAIAFRITLQGHAYGDTQNVLVRVSELEERLRGLPGVRAVAATTVLPLGGISPIRAFSIVGASPPPANVQQEIGVASVTAGYFRAIGAPLRRGRGLSDRDHREAPLVAVINEAAMREWFPDQNPVGQRIRVGGEREIVGVVANVLQWHPGRRPAPQLFVPFAQWTTRSVRFVVRTASDPAAMTPAIRAQVRAVDRNLPIADVTPLEDLVAGSLQRPRFYAAVLTLFALVALALAATGIFGVVSYAVEQRAREIGIRMALGAHMGDVFRTVVGRAVALAAVGVVLGLSAALALGRFVQHQLFGVTALDPLTLSVVVLVLFTGAVVASGVPAWRAAGVDPMSVLR